MVLLAAALERLISAKQWEAAARKLVDRPGLKAGLCRSFQNRELLFAERANLFDNEEFREGVFEVQDEGSQLVACSVAPNPREAVWDVCTGGGEKRLLLAVQMGNKGRVIATGIRPRKIEDLKKRARREGIHNIFPANIRLWSKAAK